MPGDVTPVDQLTEREKGILARLSTGLSDQQIADQLFLSLNTVKWYNRQIYSKLGVSSRTQAIARTKDLGLLSNADSASPSPALRHILPVRTTPFIGRSREIVGVKRLLQTSRLLTLTGPGGTGKTQLALRVASDVLDEFADGVYFVDLAPVNDQALVARTIAVVLDVFEHPAEPLPDTLKRALAGREVLLLIDNFEHVITATPLVSDLLAASPSLKVMVTSREALRLSDEQEYPVPPLSLPSADAISIQTVTESEAGSLFVQRAQMKQPRFALSADNAPAIAQICARLDGLPLAIELAAARCKLLTPQALLNRLDSRLDALASSSRDAPARQRTLRATIEWSYNLLDEDEKRLYERLAVFRGGRSLEAIEAICGHDLSNSVLDVLAALVDKSLVQQEETSAGEPRFAMLETIHEYAWERLEASGGADKLRKQHAEYFVELAEHAEPELRLAQQQHWFQLLEIEQENILAVLEWSLRGGDATLGVRLAGALCLYWYACGHHVEGLRWTQQLLPYLDDSLEQYHAKFLIGAAHMMMVRDLVTMKPLLERALTISRRLGDTYHTALALVWLGYMMMGEPTALASAEDGLALFREVDNKPGIAQALTIIGEIARYDGDDDYARRAYEENLAASRQTGDKRSILIALLNLTFVAQREGDYERGRSLAYQALHLARGLEIRAAMAECLTALAGMTGMTGQPHLAARLFGTADNELKRLGAFFDHVDRPEFDRMIAAVRTQLGEAVFAAAWAEGQDMTLEEAIEDILEE